jgi:hypothetical protein
MLTHYSQCLDPDHPEQGGHVDSSAADEGLRRSHVVPLQGKDSSQTKNSQKREKLHEKITRFPSRRT